MRLMKDYEPIRLRVTLRLPQMNKRNKRLRHQQGPNEFIRNCHLAEQKKPAAKRREET